MTDINTLLAEIEAERNSRIPPAEYRMDREIMNAILDHIRQIRRERDEAIRERDEARAVAQSLVSYQDRINDAVKEGAGNDLLEELLSRFDAIVKAARALTPKDTAL